MVLRSEELARIAYMGVSPPMVLYRTAIVEGRSSAHGREQRRQIKPDFFGKLSSIGLKDTVWRAMSHKPHTVCAGRDRALRGGVGLRNTKKKTGLLMRHSHRETDGMTRTVS